MSDTASSTGLASPATDTKPSHDVVKLLGGVILPITALIFELTTHLSRNVFFDPIASVLHMLLIVAVPIANLMLWLSLRSGNPLASRAMLFVSFATGIAWFYTILYIPLTVLAPFAIFFYGIGLLIIAPAVSLTCLLRGRTRMRQLLAQRDGTALRPIWPGIALALAALVAVDLPSTLTRFGMQMSTSSAPETSLSGVRLLRAIGSEKAMLQLCYGRSGRATDLPGLLMDLNERLSTDQARDIFYRVTGKPFDTLPRPQQHAISDWRNAFDDGLGGDKVAGRASGVSLSSSRMDGSLDADAATAYLEWTMEFTNASPANQEARAEIALPPGAVVSRLTLWIKGEEQEAAFGGRGQVRQAYQNVVRQNRDPVLVTTAGKDRVLVQLFPIPGHGGTMKVRLGITAPLGLGDLRSAQLQLPSFAERNFEVPATIKHAIWLESASPLQASDALQVEQLGKGLSALRGTLAEPAEAEGGAVVGVTRNPARTKAWSMDTRSKEPGRIVQTISLQPVKPPPRVVLVVDGSRSMRAVRPALIKALATFPANVELALVMAGDGEPVVMPYERANPTALRDELANYDFAGGRDNTAALSAAWDWAAQRTGGTIVWVHGAQVLSGSALDAFAQRFERHQGRVTLLDLPALHGTDVIGKKLDAFSAIAKVPRMGRVADDLSRLFAYWAPGASLPLVRRERIALKNGDGAIEPPEAEKTSDHLTRLWAATQVATMTERGDEASAKAAAALAVQHQLVTSMSGAVVLETAAQYQAAGLEPVAAGTVPTIPEPETWLMMIVALAVLAWRYRGRRAQSAGAAL